MGIIYRIVLVCAGGYTAKWLRVKKLTPPERGPEQVAISFASIQTSAADPGLGCYVTRAILGLKCFVGIGSM
jgi:hypothetical protein